MESDLVFFNGIIWGDSDFFMDLFVVRNKRNEK